MKEKRVDWIDIYRGLGIILMVAGHVGFGAIFDKIIHGFHMPIWFFISGFLFKSGKRSTFETIKHRVKTLIVPYYINMLGYYFYWLFVEKGYQNGLLTCGKSFLGVSLGITSPIAGGGQWFLFALFFADIIYLELNKHLKQRKIQTVLISFLVLGGCIMPMFISRIPFSIDAAMVALAFYHFGYSVKIAQSDKRVPIKWWSAGIFGFITVVITMINGNVNMRSGEYANVLLFFLGAIAGILMMYSLAVCLDRIRFLPICKILAVIKFIGKESISYLCMNMLVIKLFGPLFEQPETSKIASRIFLLLITLGIISGVILIYKKIFYIRQKEEGI